MELASNHPSLAPRMLIVCEITCHCWFSNFEAPPRAPACTSHHLISFEMSDSFPALPTGRPLAAVVAGIQSPVPPLTESDFPALGPGPRVRSRLLGGLWTRFPDADRDPSRLWRLHRLVFSSSLCISPWLFSCAVDWILAKPTGPRALWRHRPAVPTTDREPATGCFHTGCGATGCG